MSVNLHITCKSNSDSDMHIVCGANEARKSWVPIFQEFDLPMMGNAFSAGISLDASNSDQFLREFAVLLKQIETQYEYEDDIVNIVFRARRLARLLKEHSLDEHEIYIG